VVRTTFGPDGKPITIAEYPTPKLAPKPERRQREVRAADTGETNQDRRIDAAVGAVDESSATGAATGFVEPETIAERPKRRGRPAGSKNKVTAQVAPLIGANLQKILISMHTMGAALLAMPELEIDEDEAKLLADATANLAREYNITAILTPKAQAGIDFGIAVTTVYGTRLLAIYRKGKRKPVVAMPMPQSKPQAPAPQKVNGAIVPDIIQ
jgi:hypothetical protein